MCPGRASDSIKVSGFRGATNDPRHAMARALLLRPCTQRTIAGPRAQHRWPMQAGSARANACRCFIRAGVDDDESRTRWTRPGPSPWNWIRTPENNRCETVRTRHRRTTTSRSEAVNRYHPWGKPLRISNTATIWATTKVRRVKAHHPESAR